MKIEEITKKDIGRFVVYNDGFKTQLGRIKSYNEKFIFVVYHCNNNWDRYKDYTGCATSPENIHFVEDIKIIDTEPDIGLHTPLCSCNHCIKLKKICFGSFPKEDREDIKTTNPHIYQVLKNDGIW